MEIKLGVLNSDILRDLLSGIVRESSHSDECACDECTAQRIAADDTHGEPPSDKVYVELIKHSILRLGERGLRAETALRLHRAKLVELPVRPEFDHAMHQWRVDEYNARVRGLRTLFALLPEAERTTITAEVPEILSWEKALEQLETTRAEITEAVAKIKAEKAAEAASAIGTALRDIVETARKNGKSDEEITAVLRNAKDSMREASAEASP
jgi:chorismate mutase